MVLSWNARANAVQDVRTFVFAPPYHCRRLRARRARPAVASLVGAPIFAYVSAAAVPRKLVVLCQIATRGWGWGRVVVALAGAYSRLLA